MDLLQRVLTNNTNGPDWNSSWWRHAAWRPSSSVFAELESVRRQAAHRVIDAMRAPIESYGHLPQKHDDEHEGKIVFHPPSLIYGSLC